MSGTLDNFEYLLRLADDKLVLGHRLSEWCGHGPMLEEDIAIANVAQDLIGHATALLHLAGKTEGKGRNEDTLAYFRDSIGYRNVQLVELPRGDFAWTIARQYLFDVYSHYLYEALSHSSFKPLADIAAKASNEITYHVRHSGEWVLRLGDGTDESHQKIQEAFDALWMYTGELFESDALQTRLQKAGVAPDLAAIQRAWQKTVTETLQRATLKLPDPTQFMISGSREGRHSEHLGHLLAEMQIVQRSYPNCTW